MPGSEKVQSSDKATAKVAEKREEHRLAMAQKPMPVLMIGSLEVITQLAKRLPIGQ